MKQPLQFKRVLLVALGMMTGVYALMGTVGYFYFGSQASQLITADLETKSVLSHLRIFGVIRVCSPTQAVWLLDLLMAARLATAGGF